MKFDQWFKAQHGLRPSSLVSDADLRSQIARGEGARKELQARDEWDLRYTSALYAWQVRDRDKKGKKP